MIVQEHRAFIPRSAHLPECFSIGTTIILTKDVSALELTRRENVSGHFGVLAQISKGSTLEICGPGFNQRTYRVLCRNRLYFVFRQDLGC